MYEANNMIRNAKWIKKVNEEKWESRLQSKYDRRKGEN